MGLREAVQGFIGGLRKSPGVPVIGGMTNAPSHPVNVINPMTMSNQGSNMLDVVDTGNLPNSSNVPGSWSRYWLGPGKPFANDTMNFQGQEAEKEPRSFQYVTSVNSTISPRLAYGLMAFSDLKNYANSVPEAALCVRLLTEEMKAFIPTLIDADEKEVYFPELEWMTTKPDRKHAWPIWLSRFLFNVLVYDAPAVYKMRNDVVRGNTLDKRLMKLISTTGQIEWICRCGARNLHDYDSDMRICVHCNRAMPKKVLKAVNHDMDFEKSDYGLSPVVGLRVIDGSTIFAVIDEKGEQPDPPAPAFTQVIWGVPRMYLNSHQLWYKPRFLRPDSPYGKTFIEDAIQPIQLLANLWEFEKDKYVIGNIPEMGITCPPDWKSVEQILAFEDTFNQRMENIKERAGRIRFFPNGMTSLVTKQMDFNVETYDKASNAVRIAAGIPKSEVGEAPEGMLGGKGFAEAMASAFYRMGISPLQTFVEGLFNDIIAENGYTGVTFKLKFPSDSIDPEKEEAKWATRFAGGGITRNEYREGISMTALADPEKGEFLVSPGGGQGEQGGMPGGMGGGNLKKPVDVLQDPIDVMEKPVDVLKAEQPVFFMSADAILDLAQRVGVDFNIIDPTFFAQGIQEEMEHYQTVGGDMEVIAGIVRDHLMEDPDYYKRLEVAMAKFAKVTGVDAQDDQYFGKPIANVRPVQMPHQGANLSNIVGIGGVGQEVRPAVWKPLSGEDKKLQEWIGGDLFRRAEAVYLVDRELAKDANHYLVPVTWMDSLMGESGSVQHYVKGRTPRQDVLEYSPEFIEQAAVLDYITGQVDRKNKNWLTHPEDDKRPVLIDNDLSFPVKEEQKVKSTFVHSMAGRELSSEICDSVYLLLGNQDLWYDLRNVLGSEEAVQGAFLRATQLDKMRMIPFDEPKPEVSGRDYMNSVEV